MDVLVLVLIIAPAVCTFVEESYNIRSGFKLIGGAVVLNITEPGLSIIGCGRQCSSSCKSITYSSYLRTCLAFRDSIHEPTIRLSADPLWTVLYRNETVSPVKFGNWTLIFRAQRDVNTSVHDSWLANNTSSDNPVSRDYPPHCYRLDISLNCPTHFRSYIIDNWINITQVRFALYTDGTEVKYIVFNGTGTTSNNWFQKDKVLHSSWSSLIYDSSVQDFSIESIIPSQKRRFVINSYHGCNGDTTYFQIIDKSSEACMSNWLMTEGEFPKFMYSPLNTSILLSASPTAYRFADIMAVFVQ